MEMEEVVRDGGVRGVLHRPQHQGVGDAIVLTHGAGSNANAPLLVRLARMFAESGYMVLRFDLPFRQQRPKGRGWGGTALMDRLTCKASKTRV